MACRFRTSEVALEWWRASGERTAERLASLVDHWMYVNNLIGNQAERDAIHADALANRRAWEV